MEGPEPFERVYERNICRVYRSCLLRLGNPSDAEDAVQAVFLSYFKRRDRSFDSPEHEKAWFLKAAHDKAVDLQRAAYRRQSLPMLREQPDDWEQSDLEAESMLMALPQSLREVLYLFYFERLSVREIAQLLHRATGTIRSQLSKGRSRLKLEWEKEYEDK